MEPNSLTNGHFDRGLYQETGFRNVENLNAASWCVSPSKEDEHFQLSPRLTRYCSVRHWPVSRLEPLIIGTVPPGIGVGYFPRPAIYGPQQSPKWRGTSLIEWTLPYRLV